SRQNGIFPSVPDWPSRDARFLSCGVVEDEIYNGYLLAVTFFSLFMHPLIHFFRSSSAPRLMFFGALFMNPALCSRSNVWWRMSDLILRIAGSWVFAYLESSSASMS